MEEEEERNKLFENENEKKVRGREREI